MTIVEAIKHVLNDNVSGLTSKQIYEEIIRQKLYSFGAENPVGVVNAQLRRRCNGLDFPMCGAYSRRVCSSTKLKN